VFFTKLYEHSFFSKQVLDQGHTTPFDLNRPYVQLSREKRDKRLSESTYCKRRRLRIRFRTSSVEPEVAVLELVVHRLSRL
jgi:hypothetical protein